MQTVQRATADLITRYLNDERRRHAENTVNHRRPLLLRVARAHNGDLLGLTGDDIERWLDSTHVTRATRNTYLGSLSGFYRWCVRRGHLGHSPCDDITRVRTPKALPRPIRPDDLAKALQLARPRMRAWLSLMAYAGLRCAEVAGLHADDILWHTDPPMLHIRPHGPSHGPKGGKERIVPLAETAELALVEFGVPRAGPIFRSNGTAEPISAGYISKTVSAYLEELGVRATAHNLRHAFATDVYEQTLDLRAVQELMGHSSPDTTAIYARYSTSAAAAVVRRLGTITPS